MKKVILLLAMMFTMSVYSFAEEGEATMVAETQKYELKINHRRLACVLDMSNDQVEMSEDIISQLERDMEFAKVMGSEDSRKAIVSNAVKKNVKWMHYILNEKQYKTYLMLLNLTLEHRGFDIAEISK